MTDDHVVELIRRAWEESLQDHIDGPVDDSTHFFEVGGDSLAAMDLTSALREELPELRLRLLLDNPTFGEYAQAVVRAGL